MCIELEVELYIPNILYFLAYIFIKIMKEPSKPKLIQMNFSLIYVNPRNVSLSVTGVTIQPV